MGCKWEFEIYTAFASKSLRTTEMQETLGRHEEKVLTPSNFVKIVISLKEMLGTFAMWLETAM